MRRVLTVALAALAFTACGGGVPEAERPVARIGDETLTRGALDAYLTDNLGEFGDTPGDDADRVRSRLFDAWVDERRIVAEARRREISIGDEQLDDLLDDPDYESGEGDRERRRTRLRTRLMIDLLQSLVLQEVAPPSLEEARKRAEQVGADDEARRVELRSLRFDDPEQALKVHKDLRRNRLTFGEAVVRNTEDESQGVSTVVDWGTLPPPVREAIDDLRPGWSSVPVDLGGSTYLFQVVGWSAPGFEMRLERARAELYETARRHAWDAFVAELRAESTATSASATSLPPPAEGRWIGPEPGRRLQ